MTTTIALFPEDSPTFTVGCDYNLNERVPFIAVQSRRARVCLTFQGVTPEELHSLADRITAYLAQTHVSPEDAEYADAEARVQEAYRTTKEIFDAAIADALRNPHSPTGTSPAEA